MAEKTKVTVEVLRTFPYSEDGMTSVELVKGETAQITADCLDGLTAERYVRLVEPVLPAQTFPLLDAPAPTPREEKALPEVPENKALGSSPENKAAGNAPENKRRRKKR